MRLSEWQKNEALGCAREVLGNSDELQWGLGVLHPRFQNKSDWKKADLLLDLRTSSWCAFANADESGKARKVLRNPGESPFQYALERADNWEAAKERLKVWLHTVKSIRDQLERWPCEHKGTDSSPIATFASRRELNIIARQLRRHQVDLSEFRWWEDGRMVRLEFAHNGNKYNSHFDPHNDGLALSLRPGREGSRETVNVRTVEEFEAVINEWAASVRKEMEVPERTQKTGENRELHSQAKPLLKFISLRNIRGFRDFQLDFGSGCGDPLLAIGPNGTGKSTLLRCLALAMVAEPIAQGLLNSPSCRGMVTLGETTGEIDVGVSLAGRELSYSCRISADPDGGPERLESESTGQSKAPLVFAYGAGRTTEGSLNVGSERPELRALQSLFRYDVSLADTGGALLKLDTQPQRKMDIETSFLKIFEQEPRPLTIKDDRGSYQVLWDGERFPISSWADGYRLFFQWFIDLHSLAFELGAGTQFSGLLLVDELEQHLHPELQGTILERLQEAFPSLLIVASTHSPIVTLGVKAEQLVVLRRTEKEIIHITPPPFEGLTVEDVITNTRLFGASPYPPAKQEKLNRWNELMKIPPEQISEQDRQELQQLTDQLLSA